MKFYMLVLALDTTTRGGSVAVTRDEALLDCEVGAAARTHGERLPADLIRLLERHRLRVADVDLFAVAAGPGSLTGLRIGIATMQGLALPGGRPMVGVSTLDALARAGGKRRPEAFLGAWLDAQRGEVYAALYRGTERVDGPTAEKPEVTLARWSAVISQGDVAMAGDGALAYAAQIRSAFPLASIAADVPPLAPAVALLGAEAVGRNEAVSPDAIRPIYVRRADVELARDRALAKNR